MTELENHQNTPEEILLKQLAEIPMADILVNAFQNLTIRDTWRLGRHLGWSTAFISGGVETPQGHHSLALYDYRNDGKVILTIHFTPEFNDSDDWWGDVSLDAGVHNLGIWAYGSGDLQTYQAEVWFTRRLGLSHPYTSWVLKTVSDIAQELSEHYPISKQPEFWGGEKTSLLK